MDGGEGEGSGHERQESAVGGKGLFRTAEWAVHFKQTVPSTEISSAESREKPWQLLHGES